MKLRFTSEAMADLERIGDAIAVNNPSRAFSFVEELESRCRSLSDMPLAYPLVSIKKEKGVRRVVHGNYVIFYRADLDGIVVLHILAARMNVNDIMRLSE